MSSLNAVAQRYKQQQLDVEHSMIALLEAEPPNKHSLAEPRNEGESLLEIALEKITHRVNY